MPRIACSICGAMYDHNVYDGVCPKCGAFNQPTDVNRPVTPLWEAKSAAAAPASSNKKRNEKNQRGGSGQAEKRFVGLFLCIAAAALLAVGGAMAGGFYHASRRAALMNTPIPVTHVEAGGEATMQKGFSLFVEKEAAVLPMPSNTQGFPSGSRPFSLAFISRFAPNSRSISEQLALQYTYYAKLENGSFVYAEDFYNVPSILPDLSFSLDMPEDAYFSQESQGQFLFFLPEGTRRFTLCIQEQAANGMVVQQYEWPITVKEAQL